MNANPFQEKEAGNYPIELNVSVYEYEAHYFGYKFKRQTKILQKVLANTLGIIKFNAV